MTAYPKLASDAATYLQVRHGEWHAVPGLGGPGWASSTSGEVAWKADYSVQCGRVGLMVLSAAIWLPLLVFYLGQRISTLSQILLK